VGAYWRRTCAIVIVGETGSDLITPRVELSRQTAAGGLFPFGLGGQAPAGPRTIGLGILPADQRNRMPRTSRRIYSLFLIPVIGLHTVIIQVRHPVAGLGGKPL